MLGHQGVALSERISRHGLVEGRVSVWVGCEVSKALASPSITLFVLPADPDVEPSATSLVLCLPTCHRLNL